MRAMKIVLVLILFLPTMFCTNVDYDHRALVIDGKRRVLISGSIHYPRSTPQIFLSLIFVYVFEFFHCSLIFNSVEFVVVVVVVIDVARPYSEIQRWRT
jgi:hypothetical protein